jgi:hypothetical protein
MNKRAVYYDSSTWLVLIDDLEAKRVFSHSQDGWCSETLSKGKTIWLRVEDTFAAGTNLTNQLNL